MNNRKYHIFVINDKTDYKACITGYSMPHHECCVMLSKQSNYPNRRFILVEDQTK